MALQPNIILSGRTPDLLGSYVSGIKASDAVNEINQKNKLQTFMDSNASNLMNGDMGAIEQYAQFDLQGAMGLQQRVIAQRQAAAAAAARQRSAAASQQQDGLRRAFAVMGEAAAQGPEVFAQTAEQYGYTDEMQQYGITFENFGQASRIVNAQMGWEQPADPAPQEMVTINGQRVPANAPGDYRTAPSREIIAGADGFNYYTDTGERVLPDVQAPFDAGGQGAKEERIARMVSTGMDRETAINIVDGVWKTSTNPNTGEVIAIDLASGRVVNTFSPDAREPDNAVPAAQAEPISDDINYGLAFGIGATALGPVNSALDFVGLGQPAPETATAVRVVENLNTQAVTSLASALSDTGRPTDTLRAIVKEMTPIPAAVGGGVGDALNRTTALIRLFDEQISNKEAVINGNYSPARVQEARSASRNLQGLRNSYDVIRRSLETASGRQPVEQQLPQNVQAVLDAPSFQGFANETNVSPEALWEAMGPELRAVWLQRIGQ